MFLAAQPLEKQEPNPMWVEFYPGCHITK